MRKHNAILTSEAKTANQKKEREEIIDAVLNSPFEYEPGDLFVVSFLKLQEQKNYLESIATRAQHEDEWLRNIRELETYMLSREIDIIIIDDMEEVQ